MVTKQKVKLLRYPRITRVLLALGVGAVSYATMQILTDDAWNRGAKDTLGAMKDFGFKDQVKEFTDSAIMY